MTQETKEQPQDGVVQGLDQALSEALEEEVLDYSLLDDYEPIPSEYIGVGVDNWNQLSRKLAGVMEAARLKRYLARTMHATGKPVQEEAQKLEETDLPPLRRDLLIQTQRLVTLLAEAQNVRDQLRNWLAMQPNLRDLLWKGLRLKGIDMTDMKQRVAEREAEVRALENP